MSYVLHVDSMTYKTMVLGFILAKTLCPQRHSKVCFELLETFWVTPKDLAINGCISLQS